jgi:hypothetical protein
MAEAAAPATLGGSVPTAEPLAALPLTEPPFAIAAGLADSSWAVGSVPPCVPPG